MLNTNYYYLCPVPQKTNGRLKKHSDIKPVISESSSLHPLLLTLFAACTNQEGLPAQGQELPEGKCPLIIGLNVATTSANAGMTNDSYSPNNNMNHFKSINYGKKHPQSVESGQHHHHR
ncbi:hypothetical protein [Bacteroides stercorirosoris]|uniref:Uncharacterized protein n=1 Tax=Bacteroides stercorirosoris TaxID=871324 RepID=A0A1M6G6K7_9BACE|nr:hypothetical protein [Bacteroides stercorirosoris]SHJ05572.1 hypothetical protein SAMN05444350_11428 [Bacteroides stercorirosoris]